MRRALSQLRGHAIETNSPSFRYRCFHSYSTFRRIPNSLAMADTLSPAFNRLTAVSLSLWCRARIIVLGTHHFRPLSHAVLGTHHLVGPEIERRLNAARLRTYNRPADCWAADDGERVGSAGG